MNKSVLSTVFKSTGCKSIEIISDYAYNVFEDTISLLVSEYKNLEIPYNLRILNDLEDSKSDSDILYILFDSHKEKYPFDFKSKYIIFNMEQIDSNYLDYPIYLNRMNDSVCVFEYSNCNKNYYNCKISKPVYLIKLGYNECLIKPYTEPSYKYDVLLYGAKNSNRDSYVSILQKSGITVNYITDYSAFGDNLIKALSESKIVLNIHYYTKNPVLEITRIIPLIMNKKLVLSERSIDSEADYRFEDLIVFVNMDTIVSECKKYLNNFELLKSKVEYSFNLFQLESINTRMENFELKETLENLGNLEFKENTEFKENKEFPELKENKEFPDILELKENTDIPELKENNENTQFKENTEFPELKENKEFPELKENTEFQKIQNRISSTKINFSVVIICKNESKSLPRLFNSMSDFINNNGEIIVLDTGSVDDTVQICKSYNCKVIEVGEKYLSILDSETAAKLNQTFISTESENFFFEGTKVFNFSGARNEASTYASNDMILAIDCSDVFECFDYNFLCDKVSQNTTLFQYNLYLNELKSTKLGVVRFYNRRMYRYTGTAHEFLELTNFEIPENKYICTDSELCIYHIFDLCKSRTYGTGIGLDLLINPEFPRWNYYLGREFYYTKRYKSAIKLLQKYTQSMNDWDAQKNDAYCLIADSYYNLNNITQTIINYTLAFDVFPNRRQPLIKLGYLFDSLAENTSNINLKLQHYRKALCYAEAALHIPEGLSVFEENICNYTYSPHQVIYRAAFWLGMREYSKTHFYKALQLSNNAEFIKSHESFYL